ncbi:TPA: super-infection exclusion protein B [Vibrio parahaemolyticus]|uniref:super-infection exclusion protein B n=1 Tax=Vibrio parahaemolyticus TaxID=670 RepID=UPI000541EB30|nr:super-infection exclusion protein B [Vibrio parahaemolyticus]KHF11280.1 hypothetical protein PO79_03520 [Vibrio parahaemolyticus]HCE5137764.1 superinfection exclusion B family protein [Vibrio parahaemolyticus]
MNFSDFLKLKNLPTKHLLLLSVVSGAVLFLPHAVLTSLALNDIPSPYDRLLGLLFLLSTGLFIVDGLSFLAKNVKQYLGNRSLQHSIKNYLDSLVSSEQAVLREFYIRGEVAIKLPVDDPVVARLIEKRILTQVGTFGHESHWGLMFSFRTSDQVDKILCKEMIGINFDINSSNAIQGAEKRWLLENRPYYCK